MLASLKEKTSALTFITAAFLIAGFLYSRTYTPAWPGDFTSYLGAGYALAEGSNPYDEDSTSRCLSEHGFFSTENLPFLYSPVFALPFSAAAVLGAVWMRRIWFASLHLSFWLGLYMLVKRKEQSRKSIVIMVIFGTVLLFAGPYRAAARWGQVTAFLFFCVSFAISRQNNAASGALMSFIPLIKPALFTPVFALKGKAWLYLAATALALATLSLGVSGIEPWRQYATALGKVSTEWELSIPGNRSLIGNVHRIVGTHGKEYIREFADNHQERTRRAGNVRALSYLVSLFLILLALAGIIAAIGRKRLKQFCLSEHFGPLLCWISLLISPLAYDHYGLFLLPLLVHSVYTGKRKLYIPAAIAFTYWALVPNGNTFITDQTLLLCTEATRPILLVIVAVIYARVSSAIRPVNNTLQHQ